ncbi:MAG TPA: TfuA-like protein [Polyangiaceae bacterium]|nr:TfuA-like protein [Polyangiaceae bacterium]
MYAPPVAQGDVYRAALSEPFAIGIVDGYFEHLPSVWHKEVLWALMNGIHVFGAASMGALRAAELAPYGMRGVGKIFADYASGHLIDDDEVAIAHESEAEGYRARSDAMVNIRATLQAAEREKIIAPDTGRRLVEIAKALFYPERSFSQMLWTASRTGLPGAELEALQLYVKTNAVNQKRLDACEMLDEVASCVARGQPADRGRFLLSHTAAWDDVVVWGSSHPWDDRTLLSTSIPKSTNRP